MKLSAMIALVSGGLGAGAIAIRPITPGSEVGFNAVAAPHAIQAPFQLAGTGPASSTAAAAGGIQLIQPPAPDTRTLGQASTAPGALDPVQAQPTGNAKLKATRTSGTGLNWIDNEPEVIYDITGGTLLGPYYLHFAAYSSGMITLAESSITLDQPRAEMQQVSPLIVDTLMRDLQAAGAFTLIDSPVQVLDVPMATVTVFADPGSVGSSSAQRLGTTYSYFAPGSGGAWGSVDQILQDFIDLYFPRVIIN